MVSVAKNVPNSQFPQCCTCHLQAQLAPKAASNFSALARLSPAIVGLGPVIKQEAKVPPSALYCLSVGSIHIHGLAKPWTLFYLLNQIQSLSCCQMDFCSLPHRRAEPQQNPCIQVVLIQEERFVIPMSISSPFR